MAIWVTNNALLLLGTIQLRAKWSPESNACIQSNSNGTKNAIIGSLFSDVVLLLIMLIGLFPLYREGGGALTLARTLWKQGLIWLLIATVAEVPSTVFLILNLNAPLNRITRDSSMIIVTIAATRLYRSLTNIYSSNISLESPRGTGRPVSEQWVQPRTIPLNRMEVSVRTEFDQFSTQSRSGTCVNTVPQGRYKTHEVSLKADVESGLEEKQ
ncbi:hypothetical protein DFH94DRAFT_26175 [Russula ochroleuca]|uniref:Uncharacterized protein n=1 Tax=Russula ochroleuca TaxID=152965 RepID=A0A9P5N6V7_9AGAM|nr:hypothetical protein DFH94DRAFT_26175 [Russula ochroleuca]